MQKYLNTQYKISSLTPGFVKNINKKNHQKTSQINSNTNISQTQNLYNFIQQVPQQYNQSIQIVKNKNGNRSSSFDQLGRITQCKVFQNKIQMKKKQNSKFSSIIALIDQNIKKGQRKQQIQIQNQNGQHKSNFSEQYRMNLRRTVFNQTKQMIKMKKNKQKYSFHTIDQTKSTQHSKQLQQKKIFVNKNSFHSFRHKQGSQRISGADTMYKTIIKRQSAHRSPVSFHELDIAKFPIITRSKNECSYNLNYSNLLMALNNRERGTKPFQKYQQTINNPTKRAISRGSNFQKHQIKPWDTFVDQFMD